MLPSPSHLQHGTPSMQAVYSQPEVRRPLHNILDWEVKCRRWYQGSDEYFHKLASKIEAEAVDLAALLSEV